MSQKKETTVLLLTLLITIGAIAGGLWWLNNSRENSLLVNSGTKDSNTTDVVPEDNSVPTTVSTGNELLIDRDLTPEKEAGVEAMTAQNYPQAVSYLEESLARRRNDPEARIYLNNARIGNKKAYKIAVAVPIGTEMTTAEEILRGVAHAQDEINQEGGINGTPLKVAIVNDNNNPATAKQVAEKLVKDRDILGVVGHFSSGVTLATAPIYQKNGLVAISPSSTSVAISQAGNNIFRTVPSDRFTSNALARHTLEQLNQNQALVIYNSQSAYSNSLKDTFTTDFVSNGGEVVGEVDLSQGNFNPAEIVQRAESDADVLVFLNDSQTLDKAYLILQLNERKIPMVAGDSFYKPQLLQIVGEKAVGLVLGVPWHILASKNPNFPNASRSLWGGDVNWRTAMAYDATRAIAAGLNENPSRKGIQQTLSQSNFSFEGASGTVKFLASGDRNAPVQLVTVEEGNRSPFGYDFVPVE